VSILMVIQFVSLSVIIAVGVSVVYSQNKFLKELRDHLGWREEQLAIMVEHIIENLQKLEDRHPAAGDEKVEKVVTANGNGNGNGNGHYIRLRKELLASNPENRFSALTDWVNTNYVSFLRRAANGPSTPAHLIAHIPAYFEAQAEISPDNFLLISTRGYPEKVAVRLDEANLTAEAV